MYPPKITRRHKDAEICGQRNADERGTLCKMVDRSIITNALPIADHGYESDNLMAHIQEKSWKFLIRIKAIHSSGIAAGLHLSSRDKFDVIFDLNFTKRQTVEAKRLLEENENYKFLPSTVTFDYLPTSSRKHDPFTSYYLPFRVVRFKISNTAYEAVITSLDHKQFPPEELKRLYSMRWGIETSFRELKSYSVFTQKRWRILPRRFLPDSLCTTFLK